MLSVTQYGDCVEVIHTKNGGVVVQAASVSDSEVGRYVRR